MKCRSSENKPIFGGVKRTIVAIPPIRGRERPGAVGRGSRRARDGNRGRPADLPPLYERIDPAALDHLFRRTEDDDADLLVEFSVDEWNVFVRGDGRVRVCDATKSTRPTPVFGATEA